MLAFLLATGCASWVSSAATPPASPVDGVLAGICEASAAARSGDGWLIGDDEAPDRLFRFGPDLAPAGTVGLGDPVDDIEALAADGSAVFVVGSQSTSSGGHARPGRRRIERLGSPAFTPRFDGCAPCLEAMDRSPDSGGMNVEGAAVWDGRLWLGLRGPLVDRDALLVRTATDPTAGVDQVVHVDLGGDGVRDLTPWQGGLLVLAGPSESHRVAHRLYFLASPSSPAVRLPVDLPPHAEGLAVDEHGQALVVTDGDGKPGTPCNEPSRWMLVQLPALPGATSR